MNDILRLLPAVLAGMLLGVIFFGGLWLTVNKGLGSKRATLIFFGSLILRIAIILTGFYFVGGDSWQKLISCLVGFLIARIVITNITKKLTQTKLFIKEVSHEN
ncbi:ATP synthase subunit I [Gelidibacter sp.]|uniref:ATP synthase subunit I n=1 Tax=Gelidibacter sp. TaxID=2018083 RepID=UPI002CB55E2C|nr:ATP synthase subunit I [Gelidibacter sp.]HUH29263.1 ATP synthase subunit I [Gelidibacter sp.]